MELSDLIVDKGRVEVGMDAESTLFLCGLASSARRILEIGTYSGWTTINLAKASPPDAIVWTIDKYPRIPLPVEGYEWFHKIVVLNGDSLTFDFVSSGVTDCDLILIDGCHDDYMVGADTRLAISLASPTGKIVWHDVYDSGNSHVESILKRMGLPVSFSPNNGLAVLDVFELRKGEL